VSHLDLFPRLATLHQKMSDLFFNTKRWQVKSCSPESLVHLLESEPFAIHAQFAKLVLLKDRRFIQFNLVIAFGDSSLDSILRNSLF
jgi:hypothetical protein